MERSPKLATPFVTVTVVVPLREPPPGLAPMAMVTASVESVVTVLLLASSNWTVTAGLMAAPATAFVGC